MMDANPASGTRDFLPDDMRHRAWAFSTIRNVFELHGFDPLDTPAFERLEVLQGKYGEEGDQLIFKILRRGDHEDTGQADLALRYDLTVPLARVVARYGSQLPNPFKRYQIAPVWRADRPGKGRFREFYQCDLDIVGSDAPIADAATITALTDALAALGIEGYTVQINHRVALRRTVASYGIPGERETDALVALDKLNKIGVDGVADELRQRGIEPRAVDELIDDVANDRLTQRLQSDPEGAAAFQQIERVRELVGEVPGGKVRHEPVLARGLSYYTGVVFEITHDELDVTIAAGGRYDGLVGMFHGQSVPATGGSLGLERLLLLAPATAADGALDIVVAVVDEAHAAVAFALARRCRAQGWRTEVYAGAARLGKQFKYADRRGASVVVLAGSDEVAHGTVTVKHLATGEQLTVANDELVPTITAMNRPT